ncbi:MAG: tRNA pseudouridine(55) synthase TruB [Rhodoglobus sp.]
MKAPTNTASGVLLIDKPPGITSHDVVGRARKVMGTRKIGHAGTLDPMATGLLVLGVNSATRLLTFMVGLDKVYEATIRLGQSTTTDDAEGEAIESRPTDAVTDEAIAAGIERLTGPIEQVPSTFSAIKVDGRRAYDLARAGESVELTSRSVTISAFDVLGTRRDGARDEQHVDLDVRIACSSGTYIRALARDLGAALGVGGHLTALRRTSVGPFEVADATPIDSLDATADLRSPATVAARLFPTIAVDADSAIALSQGKRVRVAEPDAARAAAVSPDGRLVGLVQVVDGLARPVVNFPTIPGEPE